MSITCGLKIFNGCLGAFEPLCLSARACSPLFAPFCAHFLSELVEMINLKLNTSKWKGNHVTEVVSLPCPRNLQFWGDLQDLLVLFVSEGGISGEFPANLGNIRTSPAG